MSASKNLKMQQLAAITLTLILMISTSGCHCKPTFTRDLEDPLLALATGNGGESSSAPYQIAYDQIVQVPPTRTQYRFQPSNQQQSSVQLQHQQQQQPQQPQPQQYQQVVQYIVQSQPETTYQYQVKPEIQLTHEHQQYQTQPQQSALVTKQAQYYVVKSDNNVGEQQVAQLEPHIKHDANCRHKHEHVAISVEAGKQRFAQPTTREYLSILDVAQQDVNSQQGSPVVTPSREYPGEVVYISPNGETSRAVDVTGNQEVGQQEGGELSSVANYLSRNSGVAATILTEIPIRDMPYDVLNKLRRDYGVKVVATRERLGANLVINCDDASNQENSICSRPPVYETSYSQYQPQPHYPEVSLQHQPHSTPVELTSPQHHTVELVPQHQTVNLEPQHQDEPSAAVDHHSHHHLSHNSQDQPIVLEEVRDGERSEPIRGGVSSHQAAVASKEEEEKPSEVSERARETTYGEESYGTRNPLNSESDAEAAPQEQQGNSRQQEETVVVGSRSEEASTSAQDGHPENSRTEERDSHDIGF